MANLSANKSELTGGGVDVKVVATASGLDIQAVSPSSTTVGSRLRVSHAAGANANTDITITGITTSDVIVSCLEVQPPTATTGDAIKSDQTANTTITGANTIRISQSTAGNQVLVIWWDVA